MNRLTEYRLNTVHIDSRHTISLAAGMYIGEPIDRLADYEDSALEPQEVQRLAKAKAEGRLVELPCEVGNMIYVIGSEIERKGRRKVTVDRIAEYQVAHILLGNQVCLVYYNESGLPVVVTPDEIGHAVYFTREEAEKALKEDDNGRSE
ncbi:MAG: hypothetical protein J1F63_00295 [Oscillospiraceae bacterium]|nr:hypothetical protein [Oscillospiraceae bacterium]